LVHLGVCVCVCKLIFSGEGVGDTEILSGQLSRFQIHFLTSHSI
jgi:hypothetical protein